MSDAVRTIKKYPNRRLYDTANSGYITLADVKQMVLENIDFQVMDAKTGDDLTRAILLQIILDEEGGGVPDVQLRDARADDPLLRQRAADDHGAVHGAEREGVPRDPEEAAGPGEAGLRRQDDAHARPVEAVHADAGAGDAGHARQLPRAERQALHGHAAAHAGPDARHVHGVSVSRTSARRRKRPPTTTRSADRGKRCSIARFCAALAATR